MSADLLLAGFAALLGLLIGSFVNVVAYRFPAGRSVVRPASACPSCGTPLLRRDNIPVLSWLLLHGRCRTCRAAISARYPLVELLTAGVFAILALRVGAHLELVAFLGLGALGMALALIDLEVRRLPNALVIPAYPVALALLFLAAVTGQAWDNLGRALLGMVAMSAAYFVLWFSYPAGMGWGDVKLAGLLGLFLAWLGWAELVLGFWYGFLAGGIVGIALMLFRGAGRKSEIPFGPFMLLGTLCGMFWADAAARFILGT